MKNKLLITTLTLAALSTAFLGYNSIRGNAETANSNNVVSENNADNTSNSLNNSDAKADTSNVITEDEAKKIALDHAGMKESDVTNFKIKLDTDDGIKEYEVEFFSGNTEFDYDINAISGEIISVENDVEDDFNSDSNTNDTTVDSSKVITEDEAKSIALKDAGIEEADAKSIQIKLDTDDGVKEYEVEFYTADKEYDYEINASTSKILSKDVESYKINK